VINARAAIEVALRRGHSREAIASVLPSALSKLPDRRFERIWPEQDDKRQTAYGDMLVYTDYAHHPAELKCAVDMATELKPHRLRVLFQPHRYSRTKALLNEFPPAFAKADEVVLIPVYPAFEEPIPGGDIADLYAAFRSLYISAKPTILARTAEEAWRHVLLSAQPGDLVLLAGAGDIVNLVPCIRQDLASRIIKQSTFTGLSPYSFFRTGGATVGGGERTMIGMGSNIWFSDCTTDIDIVRAPERRMSGNSSFPQHAIPAGVPGASLIPSHPELAFMAGIPGTVGGWTKMNAGAFGHAFGDFIRTVITEDGREIDASDCGFDYRKSAIPGFIAAVIMKETPNNGDVTQNDAKAYLARRKVFPPRTCGSVFKNPSPDKPAGRLLEECGAKSMHVGGAYVWSEHANVIVAGEGCISSDILALARLMARAVFFRTGVRLEPEIRGLTVW